MHFQSVFRERNGPKQIFIIKFHLFWPVELVEFDGNGISCRNGCRTPRSRYHTFSILSLLFYFQVYFSSKIRFILIPLRPIIFKLHPDRPLLNSLLLARTGRTRRNDLDHFHTTKIHIFGKIKIHIHSYKIYPEIHLSKSKFTPRLTFRYQNSLNFTLSKFTLKYQPTKISSQP